MRYLDNESGRFISVDPKYYGPTYDEPFTGRLTDSHSRQFLAGDANLYVYANTNPVSDTDPQGLTGMRAATLTELTLFPSALTPATCENHSFVTAIIQLF